MRFPTSVEGGTSSMLNASVFDGHGGNGRVSKLLSEGLHTALTTELPTKLQFFDILKAYKYLISGPYWNWLYDNRYTFYDRYISRCYTKDENVLFTETNKVSTTILDKYGNIIDKTNLMTEEERLLFVYSFLKYDLEKCCGFDLLSQNNIDLKEQCDLYPGGSTATSIYLSPYNIQNHTTTIGSNNVGNDDNDDSYLLRPPGLLRLIVSQVGDSRVIICDSQGIAHSLSKPHNTSSEREVLRLINMTKSSASFNDTKTFPLNKDSFGEIRFLNNFTNTRSFGDLIAKKMGLSSEPDIYSYLIGSTTDLPHSEIPKLQFGGDECFLVLVTDGIYDLITDQELVDLITNTVNNHGLKKASPQHIAEEVINYISAISTRYSDNATCVILRLANWGNWPVIDRTGKKREEMLLGFLTAEKKESL